MKKPILPKILTKDSIKDFINETLKHLGLPKLDRIEILTTKEFNALPIKNKSLTKAFYAHDWNAIVFRNAELKNPEEFLITMMHELSHAISDKTYMQQGITGKALEKLGYENAGHHKEFKKIFMNMLNDYKKTPEFDSYFPTKKYINNLINRSQLFELADVDSLSMSIQLDKQVLQIGRDWQVQFKTGYYSKNDIDEKLANWFDQQRWLDREHWRGVNSSVKTLGIESGTNWDILNQLMFNQAIRSDLDITIHDSIVNDYANALFVEYSKTSAKLMKHLPMQIRQSSYEAINLAAAGKISFKDALKIQMGNDVTKYPTFKAKDGRILGARGYLNTVNRSLTAKYNQDVLTQQMEEHDMDLVITDVLLDGCLKCRPWENKILSLNGLDAEYPSMREAEDAGYHHPNCRHSENAYIPGTQIKAHQATYRSTKKAAEARDMQRYLERNIYDLNLKTAMNPEDASNQALLKKWNKRLDGFLKESGRTREKDRVEV